MDNVLPRPLECLLEIRRLINSSIQPRLSMISFRIIFNLTKIPAPFLRSRYSDLSIRKASDIYIYIYYTSRSIFPFKLPFLTFLPSPSQFFRRFFERLAFPASRNPRTARALLLLNQDRRGNPLFRLVPGSRPFLLPCNHIRGV